MRYWRYLQTNARGHWTGNQSCCKNSADWLLCSVLIGCFEESAYSERSMVRDFFNFEYFYWMKQRFWDTGKLLLSASSLQAHWDMFFNWISIWLILLQFTWLLNLLFSYCMSVVASAQYWSGVVVIIIGPDEEYYSLVLHWWLIELKV